MIDGTSKEADPRGVGTVARPSGFATDYDGRMVGRQASSTHSTGDGAFASGGEDGLQRQRPESLTGWGQYLFNPLSPGGIFGANPPLRTVLARADSFTGPPRRAMPFNLETDDADSIDSVTMWSGTPIGWIWNALKHLRDTRHAQRRGRSGLRRSNGQVEYPIHAVHLGERVTFLPTPLRNWWGRPHLMLVWLANSIYMILIMLVKLGLFYFLATSLIVFPTAIGGACLGLVASVRYLQKRHRIGSFDAAPAVEMTKLLALLAAMLTIIVVVVYIAIMMAWLLRRGACKGSGMYTQESITSCTARDLCTGWSPCYLPAPEFLTGVYEIILGVLFLSATLPFMVISLLVFRRARAASYYLVDNLL